jgi:hypothetical protein
MTKEYEEKLKAGQEYQDYSQIELYKAGIPINILTSEKYQREYGESIAGIEVKLDRVLEKTGNLYFETHEKSNPCNYNYVESGILRNDNTWIYCIGNYDVMYLIPKLSLRRLYDIQHNREREKRIECYIERETPTSMGFTLNADWVEKYTAARVLRFNNSTYAE